jgi:hypothetical protein
MRTKTIHAKFMRSPRVQVAQMAKEGLWLALASGLRPGMMM